jgi:hypothetical protein
MVRTIAETPPPWDIHILIRPRFLARDHTAWHMHGVPVCWLVVMGYTYGERQ